jgi:hypothetical protein
MSFDREKFLRANQTAKEKWGSFDPIPKGVYIATLKDASINQAKTSGKTQFSLVWEIDPPDELAGRKIFDHRGLEGENAEKAYEIMNLKLSLLGVRDIPSFSGKDEQEFNNNLQFMCGRTKARLEVTYDGEYQQVRIARLLENAFVDSPPAITPPSVPNTPIPSTPPQNVTQAEPPKTAPNFEKGSTVTVKRADGESLGDIININPALQKAYVKYRAGGEEMVDFNQIIKVWNAGEIPASTPTPQVSPETQAPFNSEEVEEVIEEVALQVGMNVKFNFQNKELTGEIKEIIEKDNMVKIHFLNPDVNRIQAAKVSIEKVITVV